MTTTLKSNIDGIFIDGELLGHMNMTPGERKSVQFKFADGTIVDAKRTFKMWKLETVKLGSLFKFEGYCSAKNIEERDFTVCLNDGIEAVSCEPLK